MGNFSRHSFLLEKDADVKIWKIFTTPKSDKGHKKNFLILSVGI